MRVPRMLWMAGALAGDGCDDQCTVEEGFSCTGEPSVCVGESEGDVDAGTDPSPGADAGCCSTTTDPRGAGILVLLAVIALRRRRHAHC